MTRKKRASSQRKVVLIKCKDELKYGYIRGYTFNKKLLREYSLVLIIRKGKTDISLVYARVIRGKYDCEGVLNRKTSRSKYGVKKEIYKYNNNLGIKCKCINCLMLLGLYC